LDPGPDRVTPGATGHRQHWREEVTVALDTGEYLADVEAQRRLVGRTVGDGSDLSPVERRGHVRRRGGAQRVRGDRRAEAVVLEPVDEHLAGAERTRLPLDDEVGSLRREVRRHRAAVRLRLGEGRRAVQRHEYVYALGARCLRKGLDALADEHVVQGCRDLAGFL
jgi:hypothetical protein